MAARYLEAGDHGGDPYKKVWWSGVTDIYIKSIDPTLSYVILEAKKRGITVLGMNRDVQAAIKRLQDAAQ